MVAIREGASQPTPVIRGPPAHGIALHPAQRDTHSLLAQRRQEVVLRLGRRDRRSDFPDIVSDSAHIPAAGEFASHFRIMEMAAANPDSSESVVPVASIDEHGRSLKRQRRKGRVRHFAGDTADPVAASGPIIHFVIRGGISRPMPVRLVHEPSARIRDRMRDSGGDERATRPARSHPRPGRPVEPRTNSQVLAQPPHPQRRPAADRLSLLRTPPTTPNPLARQPPSPR